MRPYALKVARTLGMHDSFAETLLNQWGLESAWGTSGLAKQNNFGGIKYSQYSKTAIKGSSGFANYKTVDDFVQDAIRVYKLPYYEAVLVAGKTPSLHDDAVAIGKSPYDAGHYMLNGQVGGKLLQLIGVTPSGGTSAPQVTIPTSTAGLNQEQLKDWAGVGIAVIAAIAGIGIVKSVID